MRDLLNALMRGSVLADRFKGTHKSIRVPTKFTMLKDENETEREREREVLLSLSVSEIGAIKA